MDSYERGGHSMHSMKVHIILVTKYRKQLFVNQELSECVKKALYKVSIKKEYRIIEMETDIDHIHILMEYRPNVSVSDMIQHLKQHSTSDAWKQHENYLLTHY